MLFVSSISEQALTYHINGGAETLTYVGIVVATEARASLNLSILYKPHENIIVPIGILKANHHQV